MFNNPPQRWSGGSSEGRTLIWVGLKNNFNWITEYWDDVSAVDKKLETSQYLCAMSKDIQMDHDLTVNKNYANTGHK